MADRHLKRFLLPLDDLADLLRGEKVLAGRFLPEDARIVSAEWSHREGAIDLLVRSDVFPDQFVGNIIPIDNGPIIAEAKP